MSSLLLSRTSQRLKALITSSSSNPSSKKSTNHNSASPNSSNASPKAPHRTSRPHSWISHTSARRCEESHSPTATTSPTPRIEPPATPKASKGRTKSAGNVEVSLGNGDNGSCHAGIHSRSESSLCSAGEHSNYGCDEGHGCNDHESNASAAQSLSGRDASASASASTPESPTSCRDAGCRIRVPRKSSRRKKAPTTTLDLFPTPPGRSLSASSGRQSVTNATGRVVQLSTLDLLEALELDPEEGLKTPTQESQRSSIELELTTDSSNTCRLPLTRTAWSDDVEQLIRETDKAFKAVSFAISDAKSATNDFRAVNWRPDLQIKTGPESPKKAASMRIRGKQAAKAPLTRNASIKATKPKRKKSKSRKMALQAFPTTTQSQSPRWSLPEVTADLFGGRMFGRLEADEMLKSEESIQQARWSRESFMSRKEEEDERKRESQYSMDTMNSSETREEDRSTPVEPFHLEELSSRLSKVKVAEGNTDFETPRPSPMPPVLSKDTGRIPDWHPDPESSQPRVNIVLPPIPPYSPLSPPTPSTLAVFNATAPLSPVSAISPPLQTFHENESTDQDPFRFGRLKFPAPPLAAPPPPPQSQPHRTSRSRSVTRTSLATIREASPIDIAPRTVSQSVPATPAKNRSPIRSPPSSGTILPLSHQAGTPNNAVNSNTSSSRSTTLLHSALHRGFKQRSNSATLIAGTEVISGSLSPRKAPPFPPNPRSAAAGLLSTPFSLTAPLFRHGSIRLNSSKNSRSFPNSGTSTGFATPYFGVDDSDGLEARVMPLDWTAFQMAISGGAGDYLMGGADMGAECKKIEEEEMEKEREEIFDWWRGFGFRGKDGGMGRVSRSEPRRPQKKVGKNCMHIKGEEEKKTRKTRKPNPDIVLAELPGDSLGSESEEEKERPFSFMPGLEDFTTNENVSGSGSGEGSGGKEGGYESEDSLPDSPMEEISEQALREGRDVLMGFNLGHDLPDFLRWESLNAGHLHTMPHVDRVRSI